MLTRVQRAKGGGGQWLLKKKSAEARGSHREDVTKKSTPWFKRGAGSGDTGSRKEGWRSRKVRPERQDKEAATVYRGVVAQTIGPGLDVDTIPETELTKDDPNPFSFISGPKQAI